MSHQCPTCRCHKERIIEQERSGYAELLKERDAAQARADAAEAACEGLREALDGMMRDHGTIVCRSHDRCGVCRECAWRDAEAALAAAPVKRQVPR